MSVQKFAQEVNSKFDKIDILLNNAGLGGFKKRLTPQGFESVMGINHVAHFYLTHELSETLKASSECRIVNVSSSAHQAGRWWNVEDINMDKVKENEDGIGM